MKPAAQRVGGGPSAWRWLATAATLVALAVASQPSVPAMSSKQTPPAPTRQAPAPAQAPLDCPPSPSTAAGRDFRGKTLAFVNFSYADLVNADFRGATLKGVVFVRADLTGANFSGATFVDAQSPVRSTDFSFAKLESACFIGAQFGAQTHLAYATLACADFSQTDLATGRAIFGDSPLRIETTRGCRARFRQATMNCEFIDQWNKLDLTGASVAACANLLASVSGQAGRDFSGGAFGGVVFDGLDLSRSKWDGAVLERASFAGATLDHATGLAGADGRPARLSAAKFNRASVRWVDLSNAQLYGAQFTNADLSYSRLAGAFLQAKPDATPPIETAAAFDGARLKGVDLSSAKLQGATFQYASFYGDFQGAAPSFPCQPLKGGPPFTNGCATAAGATLTGTNFSNAFLYGVDFGGGTVVNGTAFGSAILTAANFVGARFAVNNGAAPDFDKAMLQGAAFDSNADLVGANLLNAFVDFGAPGSTMSGNNLFLLLGAEYTGFRNWSGTRTPCVQTTYGGVTAAPAIAAMTCPDGRVGVCGNGRTTDSLVRWKSGLAIAANAVPGKYQFDATYDKASGAGATCTNGAPPVPGW